MNKRPILISLSPNAGNDDILLALKILMSPFTWFESGAVNELESEFSNRFGKSYKTLAVNSGRSALYLILKAMGIKEGDEVALQALTCVAVPNAVLWLGAIPIYIDIDETLGMDPINLSNKLTRKTKAIIVQHSFGYPAKMDEVKKIAEKWNIPIIEDCALSLGGKYKGVDLGTIGDVSFFSFGRDKVVSSVFGGMVLCKDNKLYENLLALKDQLENPSRFWVFQQLMHPILLSVVIKFYNFGIRKFTLGKILLVFFQKIGFLSKAVYDIEKRSERPSVFPTKMPGALAKLAQVQLKKLNTFNEHRKLIAKYYGKSLKNIIDFKLLPYIKDVVWVRYPIISKKSKYIYDQLKKRNILLGDWYKNVIMPVGSMSIVKYKKGMCPRAESIAGNIINLPTYPLLNFKQAEKVVQLIKLCLS